MEDLKAVVYDVQAVKDFQVCELFHKYRHQDNIPIPISARDLLQDKFENTLKRVVSFFFYKKQGGIVPSSNALLNRWEKLWFPKEITAYDIAIERHTPTYYNLVSLSNVATASLLQFYEDFSNDTREVIMIDEKFYIPINRSVRLSGEFDLVLRSNGAYTIIKWSSLQKKVPTKHMKFDFAAQRLAFEIRNTARKDTNKVSYGMYDLASTSPGFVDCSPSSADVNSLLFWINELSTTDVFVPRRGYTTYCRGCPFDTKCVEWDGWPKPKSR